MTVCPLIINFIPFGGILGDLVSRSAAALVSNYNADICNCSHPSVVFRALFVELVLVCFLFSSDFIGLDSWQFLLLI